MENPEVDFDLNFDFEEDGDGENDVDMALNQEIRQENQGRFPRMTDQQIRNIAAERSAQSTKNATAWGVKIFKSE